MIALPGYQILAQIYESASSLIYRGIRNQDNQPVILKVLKQEYPPLEELTRYKQEYKITRSLNLEGVVKAYDLQKYQNTLVMLLEDFGGGSLKGLMASRKFKLAEFLAIAIRTTEVLAEIHKQNIIHKDINPSNIVFNPATGQLKVIDFGIATALPRENPTIKNPNVLEGTLAYISPEQTGRMNRSLDYRTDFYSLGATFYELLVQQVPFDATDALELVHCHIALTPIAPNERSSEIPKPISDIVMKLLAKTAEERYQSAWGIKADLEVCLQQLQTKDKIGDFLLGSQDISNKFQIPQKLYGREQEIATLMTAFERVSQGHSEMMLVSGYSGIGKSALVQEIYKPITRQRGYFISGKFDQFQSNIPYSAVVNAFRELVRQLLAETEDQLNRWREKLLAAFGPNGQIIIDVIPEVELIVGEQPVADELPPAESHNRFNLVFQNFISVFTKPEHPLVIFLDDLQWADSASLHLIQLLMSYASILSRGNEKGRGNANSQYLFLIGAYRDNEVFPVHPLMLTLNEIKKTEAIINHIYLSDLNLNCVTQLLAETIKSEIETVKLLAELVLQKTNGNPFFINEFLQKVYAENLLEFDFSQRVWQFELKQIQTMQITDNVIELLMEKIQKLPDKTQQILKLAACIGNKFDLKTLSIVNKKSQTETANELWNAVYSGLVTPIDNDYKIILLSERDIFNNLEFNYKFLHDKVQQAAYSLIPTDCKQIVHLQVGKLLLENPHKSLEEKIFNVVNQLNLGIDLIANQQDKDELALLNLTAGKKAKASAAYEPALNYLNVGIGLLDADSWEKHYQLTLCILVEAVEAAYLSGHFEQMEQLTEVVLQRAKTLLDKVKVYEVKIQAYRTQNKLQEAVKIGLAVLNLLKIFPKQPEQRHVFLSRIETKLSLVGKQIEDLIDLPEMTNPDKLAAMQILSRTWSVAYLATPELLPLIVVKMVHLSVRYGNTSISAYAYATYGLLLCGVLGDIDSGYQFGQLALNLLARLNAKELKAKTYMVVNTFIRHWKEHINATLQPLLEAYQTGLEIGDLEYLAYSALNYCAYSYLIGKELSDLEREIATYSEAIRQFKQESCVHVNELYRQAVLNLMGYGANPCQLVGESFDEEKMLPFYLEANDRAAISFLYINKVILCYLFAEYNQAAEYAAIGKQYLDGVIGTPNVPLFNFYDSLTLLAVFSTTKNLEKKRILRKVAANQNKMKKWAAHAPMNYLHKFYLVEAERLRVLGQAAKAMDYYDRAIESAKKYEYINEEALAHELAAKFYLATGKDKIAQVYMVDAHYCYLRWGATGKVRDLETRYPELFFKQSLGNRKTSFPLKTSNFSNTTRRHGLEALDLSTVMKASQAISGEIVLDKLLTKLMKILIENAGAQKGFLILETKGKLLIEAAGAVDADNVTVLQSVPVESSQNVSSAIVNYVARTKESVVLNEATSEDKFTSDPYLQEQKPKSILCTPLINQGQLSAILYLENNLTTAAFTPDRLEVLRLLSAQAAISINLAQLYSQLRESEHRLAQFLEAVPVGLTILDARGRVYYTNRIAQQLLGKGVVPDTTFEQLPEVYQVYISGTEQLYPCDQLAIAQALRGERATHDDLEIHKGNKVIPLESWGTPIYDEKGNVVYAMAAFQDITERKRAEAERLKFTNQLVQLNQAYSHFVPCQFLQLLNKESIVDVKLGDQVQKEMTILFSDIRNFTTLSEMMVPEDNFKFINAYLSRMEPAIIENHGFIDKYIGDEIMALFSGSADDAVKAGIAMLHRLAEYNTTRVTTTRPPIRIGIGINTGSLMLGTVGGANRMDGTVISDAVNLASRIEGLTKNYRVSLLISHHTFLSLQNANQYAIRILDRVKVKGKSELVTVYEVFDGDLPEVREGKLITKTVFEKALMLYSVGAVSEAVKLFQDCLHVNPRDTVAQIYLERCHQGS